MTTRKRFALLGAVLLLNGAMAAANTVDAQVRPGDRDPNKISCAWTLCESTGKCCQQCIADGTDCGGDNCGGQPQGC